MSVVKLEPKKAKPDLKVEYLGEVYILPGNISAAMIEQMYYAKDANGDEGFLKMFLADILPAEMKSKISSDDLGELAKIWVEYVQGPKGSGSTN